MNAAGSLETVAVVGAGVIGRSWAIVFARAGCRTALFDTDPRQLEAAREWIEAQGLDNGRVAFADSLEMAVGEAGYVQECGPERLPLKQDLFASLDRAAPAGTILASSTSAFDMSDIARGVGRPDRCVVAHPVNPPHVVPLVEVLGGVLTSPTAIERTMALLGDVGQRPVLLKKHIHGFVLNRLQFALVREAIHLLNAGVGDVDTIDAAVREGLGLRWALLGPFAVADTNKDDGVRAYFGGFEEWITDLMNQLGPTPVFDAALIERIGAGVDAARGEVPRAEMRAWRDRMVTEIRRLKAENPLPARQGQPS
jgi:L-gulonate 3-dehydrogenase